MKSGKLNKTELASIARSYLAISTLLKDLPDGSDPAVLEVRRLLFDARLPLANVLRWQDFSGTWQKLKDV